MKRSKAPLLLGLGCVLAVGMMLYPMASNWLSGQTRSQVITEYETAVEVLDNQATQQALELAQAYNRDLLEQSCSIAGFSVSGAPTPGKDILTALDPTGGGMLATLEIPAIDVILPVYYGTQSTTLTAGVGVVEGSSLPVGGTGSHAVLAGHSGLASSRLLSDLDQLAQGDVFFLRVLDETLAYEVDQISVVLPDDVSQIGIDPQGDYVTLLTCTPYGVNSHRLLVRGTRTEWSAEDTVVATAQNQNHESSWWSEYRTALCIGEQLKTHYEDSNEFCVFAGNYNIGCELDALFIKKDAIISIEFKNYGGNVVANENGEWTCNGKIIKGGSRKTVLQQARINHSTVKKELKVLGVVKNQIKDVPHLIIFHQPIELENNLSATNRSWLHIDRKSVV